MGEPGKKEKKAEKKRRKKRDRLESVDLPPGTFAREEEEETPSRLFLMRYDNASLEERELGPEEDLAALAREGTVTWIHLAGLAPSALRRLGEAFDIHPLVLEDIASTDQRPKLDDLERYLFLICKRLQPAEGGLRIEAEQISLLLLPGVVLSFAETAEETDGGEPPRGDPFPSLRERIRTGKGRIRKMGADYLAYAILDSLVDRYFLVVEEIDASVDSLEEDFGNRDPNEAIAHLHRLKRNIVALRRATWPLRDVISALRYERDLIDQEATGMYLRDLYDHTVQINDTLETFRDILTGMLELFLSRLSHRLNEVMKVLTIISTIFIPLTFIAGVYGMNFEYMPELGYRWAYPLCLAVMALITAGMVAYFRHKRWI